MNLFALCGYQEPEILELRYQLFTDALKWHRLHLEMMDKAKVAKPRKARKGLA